MSPADFTTWMRGVAAALGSEPPTPERWARIVAQLHQVTYVEERPLYAPLRDVPAGPWPSLFPLPPVRTPADSSPYSPPFVVTCGQAPLDLSTTASPANG